MAHCKDCGRETSPGQRMCYSCLDDWQDRRKKAFDIAEKELGKLSAVNHKAITKRVKQLEKEFKTKGLS